MVRLPMQLTPWQMTLLTAIGYLITLGSYGILFHLGVRLFYKAIQKKYYTLANVFRLPKGAGNGISEIAATSMLGSETPSLEEKRHVCGRCRRCDCWPYYDRPLIFLGFFSLIASIIIRMPCLYDFFLVYWNEKDYLCLTTVILFICVHLAWLMLWFGFAMKQKWHFHVNYLRTLAQCPESGIHNTFMPDLTVSGGLTYTPIQECNEETAFPF